MPLLDANRPKLRHDAIARCPPTPSQDDCTRDAALEIPRERSCGGSADVRGRIDRIDKENSPKRPEGSIIRRCDSSFHTRSAHAIERATAMQRKNYFPPEADTQPDVLRAKLLARRSDKAPKGTASRLTTPPSADVPSSRRDARSEAPPRVSPVLAKAREGSSANPRLTARPSADAPPRRTLRSEGPPRADNGASGIRARRPRSDRPAACVDEVVADLSHDPRHEPD